VNYASLLKCVGEKRFRFHSWRDFSTCLYWSEYEGVQLMNVVIRMVSIRYNDLCMLIILHVRISILF